MPRVVFILQDGDSRTADVPVGTTVLTAALKNGVDGIIGECGGVCMCATCHIYVNEDFLEKLPPIKDTEEAVLEVTNAERLTNSRLSCQIKMTEELDGLTVQVPPSQR
jgi:2Fe-2S ferredoxin